MMNVMDVKKLKEDQYEILSPPCPLCKQTTTITISGFQLYQYRQGAGATTVLPQVDVDVRERFMSGTCGPCWNTMFNVGDTDE
jgi:hypothetical protein